MTWFFPKEPGDTKLANVSATQLNLLTESDTLKRGDHAVASIITDLQDGITKPNIREAVNGLVHSVCQHMPLNPKSKSKRGTNQVMFESCCSPDSMMGKIHEELGLGHIRLTAENSDMSDRQPGQSLQTMREKFPGADLWHAARGQICKCVCTCTVKATKEIAQKSAQGGHVAFEWPKNCAGWSIPKLIKFIKRHNLFEATFDGREFGLVASEGLPHRKPWRVVTSSWRFAKNLNAHKCKHPHGFAHSQVAGNETALTAYHPEAVVRYIATSLYPSVTDKDFPAMPTRAFKQHDHVPSDQPEPELDKLGPTMRWFQGASCLPERNL